MFILYPLIRNIYISFTDFNVIKNEVTEFVGAKNYLDLLKDKNYLIAFRNTLLYALVTVPGQMFFGLILASLVNSVRKGQTFFKVVCYLPVITSWVVVSLVFKYLFMSGKGGLINYALMQLHVIRQPIAWLQNEWTANVVLWLFGIWKGVGWVMIIYLAARRASKRGLRGVRDRWSRGGSPLLFHDPAHGTQHHELPVDGVDHWCLWCLYPRHDDHGGRAAGHD